jgi:uncharacterized membrane protein
MPIDFQGHVVWPYGLAGDIALALIPIVAFLILRFFSKLPKIGTETTLWHCLIISPFVLWIPNAAYAALEIKHLFVVDNVAENPDFWSYIVFGGVSLLGLFATIYLGQLVIDYYAKTAQEQKIYAFFLSFINGSGAYLGLLGFDSQDALNPNKYHQIVEKLPTSPDFMITAIVLAICLFVIFLLINHFRQPPL